MKQQVVLPSSPFWLLGLTVKQGECVPYAMWLWWHWQILTPKIETPQ